MLFQFYLFGIPTDPHADHRAHGVHDNHLLYGRFAKRPVCIFSHGNHHDSCNGRIHFLWSVYSIHVVYIIIILFLIYSNTY